MTDNLTSNEYYPNATAESYVNVKNKEKEKNKNKYPILIKPHEYESLDVQQERPVRIRKQLQRYGTVCCDYQAKEHDELSLRHGSVVEIIKEECGEAGWVLAKVDNRKGMIPKNYVVLVGMQPSFINSEEVQRTQKLLGSGGFADVYLGYYKSQEVALKVSRANSDRDRETLTREALILSRMTHKNIVGFHGLSLNPLFIVLELCEGGTLFTLGRKMSSSDVFTVIYWARQVGEAIQHLHSREDPLLYADLKAENVLIKEIPCECGLENESWKIITNYRQNGLCRKCNGLRIDLLTLKLADFNVSRSLNVKRDSCAGSLLWMPPEVIKDRDFSKSSDVWSFGMFLWEIFSRKVPFKNCELQTIISAIIYKTETLPLPPDLPTTLRNIFEQCWRKKPEERPSVSEVLTQLEQAEQSVENDYKWILQDENLDDQKSLNSSDFEVDLENLSKECSEGKSITIPLYEAVMFMERLGVDQKIGGMFKKLASLYPPTPAKRQKKLKLFKESIGAPSDFRHNVSARLRSASPPQGERKSSGSREKLLVIRYMEDDEDENTNQQQQQMKQSIHHRSHDSLIYQGKDDSSGYSTLPRNFKQNTQQSSSTTAMANKWSQMVAAKNCSNKVTNLASNEKRKNGSNNLCKLRHDYLTLAPCACIHNCQHKSTIAAITKIAMTRKRENKSRRESFDEITKESRAIIIDEFNSSSSEESKERELIEYTNITIDERKLNRVNAVRPKISQQQNDANNPASSSSCSSSLDGFVVVGGGGDLPNAREYPKKQMNLPELFNRQVSPPQQQQSPIQTPTSRVSTINNDTVSKEKRRGGGRKTSTSISNEQMPNSIFYVPPVEEEESPENPFDQPSEVSRHRSRAFGWVNRIFGGTSPRHSASAEDELVMRDGVIETAKCNHPNHELCYHLCPLRPAAALLPETNLSRIPELKETKLIIKKANKAIDIQKGYRKHADNPEKQRQRHRTESSTTTILSNCPKERLSMNTVISMQQPINLNDSNLNSPHQPPIPARSFADLVNLPMHNHLHHNLNLISPSSSLLSPGDRIEHQRSRSSENPSLSQSTTNELVQRLLQPVPNNALILNPSYVPMKDNNQKLPPPISDKKMAPVPLPRSKLPVTTKVDQQEHDLPWPTSQAPTLNRTVELMNNKPIQRPNSLGLIPLSNVVPPLNQHSSPSFTTPTTSNSNSLFTNSSINSARGGIQTMLTHCDSGIDPEAGTEGENSPYPNEAKSIIEPRTVFPSTPNSSPKTHIPSHSKKIPGPAILQNRTTIITAPKLPTTSPPPPPLPPKRIVEGGGGGRVPPIPKTMKKVNRF